MYRIVYEVNLKGMPSELNCLTKFYENFRNISKCVGSPMNFVCFYKNIVIKIIPRVSETTRFMPMTHDVFAQTMSISIIIESKSIKYIFEVVDSVYNFVKNCGLIIRLVE